MEKEIRKKPMQKVGIRLTHEDWVWFAKKKAEAGKHDKIYEEMTLSEYVEIVLHHMTEGAEPVDKNL